MCGRIGFAFNERGINENKKYKYLSTRMNLFNFKQAKANQASILIFLIRTKESNLQSRSKYPSYPIKSS